DESIPTPIEEPFSATPPPPSSPFLPEAQKVSYTILTPIFQKEREIEIEEEKEQEEERGCQGGGETFSAGAEPLSVLQGERNHFKKDQIQNQAQTILDFYNQQFDGLWKGKLRFTRERECQIRARLKSFTGEELKEAMVNLRRSSFHCGNNDKEKVYATPEFLFRNDSQVDTPGSKPTKPMPALWQLS
ncbi:MAG: hypothetical protein NTX88_07545, partial [Candidatus Atribacteria bacterium]|nr:hypothetical protein [Candidatus Atribacteria bacterium]